MTGAAMPPRPTRSVARPTTRAALLALALVGVAVLGAPATSAQVPVGTTPVTAVGPTGAAPAGTVVPTPLPANPDPVGAVPAAGSSGTVGSVVPTGSTAVTAVTASTVAASAAPSSTVTATVARGTATTRAGASTTTSTTIPTTPEALRNALAAILANAGSKNVSALMTVDGLGVVIEINADQQSVPASTNKLYVAGAVLLRLGPNHRFVTEIRTATRPVAGAIAGDLVIVAGGDPSLTASNLAALADKVVAAGVTKVVGGLVIDDYRHSDRVSLDGWKASFSGGEVGRLSAFVVDANKGPSADPSLSNLAAFRKVLARKGVTVVGPDRRGRASGAGEVLGSHSSAPLTQLVTTMDKKSDNTYAEMLLREVGVADGQPSTAGGVAAVKGYAAQLAAAAPVMADGSGLSSLNRVTPRAQVAWLQGIATTGAAGDFLRSLPVACVDGTLRSRMCGTAASGKTSAKTGYLTGTTALTGYTTTASGRNVSFSFLLNGVSSTWAARTAIDGAVAMVSSYQG